MSMRRRPRQVADLIRAELALLIQQELRDPRVGFVTLTAVRMSPDLRLTEAVRPPLARLFRPPLTEAQSPLAVLPNPPLTEA